MEVSAIIIDDEKHCTEMLQWEIEQHCKHINVLGVTNSAREGLTMINDLHPDVVFLDIEMPVMNGFELLQQCDNYNFEVIFTTAYDQFAIKAIRVSALDYLLKPINKTELLSAVEKLRGKLENGPGDMTTRIDFLMEQLDRKDAQPQKIVIPLSDGLEIIDFQSILYCKASSNYTELYLVGGRKIVISKTLKQVEEMLSERLFLRVHQSYLVNLNHVKKYVRGGGGYLILDDKSTVNVSQSRKDVLFERLQAL